METDQQSIQPLRISKSGSISSPTRMPAQRPLSELSPMAQRRNSPSYTPTSKASQNQSSSPFDSSPLNSLASPRLFWQGRDPASPSQPGSENRNPLDNFSSKKRPSVENLKRASRVKNSSMFAREQQQEYDPAGVKPLDRPLAAGRPLSSPFQGGSLRGSNSNQTSRPSILEDTPRSPFASPGTLPASPRTYAPSPSRDAGSPTKSSLSKTSRLAAKAMGYDMEDAIYSDDDDSAAERELPKGKILHRHAKSVTFDVRPPQINEYEMTTPDPSSIASGSREGSYDGEYDDEEEYGDYDMDEDREDSFDAELEDTDKTPVVLPEDWRFMSHDSANEELDEHDDDVFVEDASPGPDARPSSSHEQSTHMRIDSLDSNGERRPLPPLPQLAASPLGRGRSESNGSPGLSVEHLSPSQRLLPTPPQLASRQDGLLSFEERLRNMHLHRDDDSIAEAEKLRERRLRRGGSREKSTERDPGSGSESKDDVVLDTTEVDEYKAPRISRESILRNIKNQQELDEEDTYNYDSRDQSLSPQREYDYDPDVAIPSTEDISVLTEDEFYLDIKEESVDIDLNSIPREVDDAVVENAPPQTNDDDASLYSRGSGEDNEEIPLPPPKPIVEDDGESTPLAVSPARVEMTNYAMWAANENKRMSLPRFTSSGDDDFNDSLREFMTPSPPVAPAEPTKPAPKEETPQPVPDLDLAPKPRLSSPFTMSEFRASLNRPVTPDQPILQEDEEEEPSTPESVIRHPIEHSEDDMTPPDSPVAEEMLVVPDRSATVRAPGTNLKTRASLTPNDAEGMAATRRKVSGGDALRIPSFSEGRSRPSLSENNGSDNSRPGSKESATDMTPLKRIASLVPLDLSISGDLGTNFALDEDFDRVIEAQKRGYLMRQNTKVVIATSNRIDEETTPSLPSDPRGGTKSAGSSPRKSSQPTWTAEPWNGQMRRKSIKVSGAHARKKMSEGAVPPLPGMPSAVQNGLQSVEEGMPGEEELEDGEERGRLFVKVVGVKDLDLALPKSERSYFALTLDNGLHCVTTSWLELGRSAPIGQEFELVVLNDLEFQLTLQMKLEEPKPKVQALPPVSQGKNSLKKGSTLSRMFGSPKKRKELELKAQQEATQQKQQAAVPASPWDHLRTVVARDGSFGRAYFSLSEHEDNAYGRPYTVDIACFNEWAMDTTPKPDSSVKSKRSTISGPPMQTGPHRLPPYKIGKLELQILYVPKPRGAKDEDMPKSMNSCIREMRDAEAAATRVHEGFLSQQGGDCPYWRRRFFKLAGAKLTAYHETTNQPRATINLAKAAKLIDDKSSLTQKETSGRNGKRRKSAFAEEEEGYMFVEEGFRIRFANGEVIDFYADNTPDKEGWMKVLSEVVGVGKTSEGGGKVRAWTGMVLKREKSLAGRKPTSSRTSDPTKSATGKPVLTPNPNTAGGRTDMPPLSPGKEHRPTYGHSRGHSHSQVPVKQQGQAGRLSGDARRAQTKSVLF